MKKGAAKRPGREAGLSSKGNWLRAIFLPDRFFLTWLIVFGIITLSVTESWSVYTDPFRQGSAWMLAKVRGAAERFSSSGKVLAGEGDAGGAYPAGQYAVGKYPDGQDPMGQYSEDPYQDGQQLPGPSQDSYGGYPDLSQGEETREIVYESVEDEYFADALFIGDSRTVGLYQYGGLQEISTFYASTGLTVYKLFTAKIVEVPDEKQKLTVEEALSRQQFAKIYFMIGINEMGTGTVESFLKKYAECVAHIRELQPEAVIYLQSILQITAERSSKEKFITNEGIDARNIGIEAMADGEQVFYLDVNEAVCGEDGTLEGDYTNDGVHLKAQYIPLWKDYLKAHAVVLPGKEAGSE